MTRLISFLVRRYLGGPGRSWLFSSLALLGYRSVRSLVGRREVIDVGSIGKGSKIVIEHLPISHKSQIKAAKQERKAERRQRRAAKAQVADAPGNG